MFARAEMNECPIPGSAYVRLSDRQWVDLTVHQLRFRYLDVRTAAQEDTTSPVIPLEEAQRRYWRRGTHRGAHLKLIMLWSCVTGWRLNGLAS